MKITHHLDDATLMSFAAGTLGEALSVVVASHLDWCPSCRRRAHQLDVLGAVVMQSIDGEEMSCSEEAVFARADNITELPRARRRPAPADENSNATALPLPLEKLGVRSLDDVQWTWLGPGVRSCRLPLSNQDAGGDLRLLRIGAGRKMPEHGHGGTELTLVLNGAYEDKFGRFGRGDVADVDEDAEHQPIVTNTGECICLVASEHPAKFNGILGRILQPIVGM